MKRYLLFAGYGYYPSGGWDDWIGDFDTVEEAQAAERRGDWYHIIDTETKEEVKLK